MVRSGVILLFGLGFGNSRGAVACDDIGTGQRIHFSSFYYEYRICCKFGSCFIVSRRKYNSVSVKHAPEF